MILHARPRRASGFTLLELLTVLMVLGILIAVGVPSFAYLSSSTKMKTASSNLHLALMRARSEAVKRDTPVTITPVSGGNWATGWQITVNIAGVDTVLSRQEALPQVAVSCAGGCPGSLVYQGSGRISGTNAVRFNLAPAPRNAAEQVNLAQARCISVLANGSPFLKESACS